MLLNRVNYNSMINKFSVLLKLTLILLMAFAAFAPGHSQLSNDSLYKLSAPLPAMLITEGMMPVDSKADWEQIRRDEVLGLFQSHVYGRVPEMDVNIDFQVKNLKKGALGGGALMKEVEVGVKKGEKELVFTILIFLPSDSPGAAPLFLGLNFNGNHTIHPCEEISITSSWVKNKPGIGVTDHKAVEQSRGSSASRWPVEMILEKGYGVATIYCGDIDPDFDDGFVNGIQGLIQENGKGRRSDSWGTIAAWAWGLSRAMDYFESDPAIDQERVAVIGHSRRGKTSLWAGASDQRFALVVSNNSGCGGAALSRRPFGESVRWINKAFPHWFASKFHEYGDNEGACPVDQHMLLALMAPRPLYVASASEDLWADPRFTVGMSTGSLMRMYWRILFLRKWLNPDGRANRAIISALVNMVLPLMIGNSIWILPICTSGKVESISHKNTTFVA